MKLLLLAAAVFGLPLVSRAEENASRAAHAALAQKIQQAFPYEQATIQKKEEEMKPDSQVVTMERVVVVESSQLRRLREKIDAEREKAKAEQFSIIKGGAILKKDIGKARIELGTWGAGSGLNILRISW